MTDRRLMVGETLSERLTNESSLRAVERIYDMTKVADTGRTRTWIGLNGFLVALLGFYFGTGHMSAHPGVVMLVELMPQGMLVMALIAIVGDAIMSNRYFWYVSMGETEEQRTGSYVNSFGLLRKVSWFWDLKYQYTYVAWAIGLGGLVARNHGWLSSW